MESELRNLKLRLLAEGLTVGNGARKYLASLSGTSTLTLADYASTSGISLRLPEDIWVNAPIAEHNPNFVTNPPLLLDGNDSMIWIETSSSRVPVEAMPIPSYWERKTADGTPYVRLGCTHTDRLRISPIEGCAFGCQFCDMPRRYAYHPRNFSLFRDLIDSAVNDQRLPAHHMMISGGTPQDKDVGWLEAFYEAVVINYPSIPVDLMMAPSLSMPDVRRLAKIGVNELSLNLELFSEKAALSYMPQKASDSVDTRLKVIERAVDAFGPGRVRSMLLVGIEPLHVTVNAVSELAQRGCVPVLSPFRPSPITPMGNLKPPSPSILIEVLQRSEDAAAKHDMRLGPRCIPCQHNTLTFPDHSGFYHHYNRGEDGVIRVIPHV